MKSIALVQLFLVITSSTQVFVDQPDPGRVFLPVKSQLQLTCSVIEGYAVFWKVNLPDRDEPLETDSRGQVVLNVLRQRNITITSEEADRISTLSIIYWEVTNNGIKLACFAINQIDATRTFGNEVQLTFYGPPPPPIALTATENVLGPTPTALTATENVLGPLSGPSETLNRSISMLPDISLIEDSLTNYTLSKTADADSVTLNVTLHNEVRCLEYPIIIYTLIAVENSSGNATAITSDVDPSSNSTEISIELLENLKYSFSVIATNQFGNSSESTTVDIKTTDVQNVSIECIEGTNYSIQCSYLVGSDARGCRYSFANEVNGSIGINKSAGDTVQLPNIPQYNEVVAYDWESDGTFGDVAIGVAIPSNIACPSITTTTYTTATTPVGTANKTVCSTSTILASVITAISTALLATVIFVLVQIALCKCRPKATPGEAESAPSAGENRQAVYEQVDVVDEGGIVSDTIYAEVHPGGKGTFALKTNEAYGVS